MVHSQGNNVLILFVPIIATFGSSRNSSSIHDNQAQCFPLPRQSLPGGATLTSGSSSRVPFMQGNKGMDGRSSSNLSITPSVTITPTSGPVMNLKTKNVRVDDLNDLTGN